jgi:hypothetical protein
LVKKNYLKIQIKNKICDYLTITSLFVAIFLHNPYDTIKNLLTFVLRGLTMKKKFLYLHLVFIAYSNVACSEITSNNKFCINKCILDDENFFFYPKIDQQKKKGTKYNKQKKNGQDINDLKKSIIDVFQKWLGNPEQKQNAHQTLAVNLTTVIGKAFLYFKETSLVPFDLPMSKYEMIHLETIMNTFLKTYNTKIEIIANDLKQKSDEEDSSTVSSDTEEYHSTTSDDTTEDSSELQKNHKIPCFLCKIRKNILFLLKSMEDKREVCLCKKSLMKILGNCVDNPFLLDFKTFVLLSRRTYEEVFYGMTSFKSLDNIDID